MIMENLKQKKQLLKSILSTYQQLDITAYSLTDYKDSKNVFDTLESMKKLLIQFGVIHEQVDSDGITYTVDSEFE